MDFESRFYWLEDLIHCLRSKLHNRILVAESCEFKQVKIFHVGRESLFCIQRDPYFFKFWFIARVDDIFVEIVLSSPRNNLHNLL